MGKIELLNIDCLEFMRTCKDAEFDLAIVDPPYGIEKQISQGGGSHTKSAVKFHQLYSENHKTWDIAPSPEYFEELFRVSKNQIIWGANYFEIPKCRCFIFWDKCVDVPNFSAGEYAWTSFDKPAVKIEIRNTVEIQKAVQNGTRIHPTQKPVKLYAKLISLFAKEGDKILDTHLGSGSIALAVNEANQFDKMNLDFIGCEIDTDYFNDMNKRFKNGTAQNILQF